MKNERGAGRKAKLNKVQIDEIQTRRANGEKVAELAKEYGISRQALSRYLNPVDRYEIKLQYGDGEEVFAEIYVDTRNESLHIVNYVKELSKLPFSWDQNPSWKDFIELLEREYLGLGDRFEEKKDSFICLEKKQRTMRLSDIVEGTKLKIDDRGDVEFEFSKKDLIISKTDTDGYQMKALSADRKWFVKSQAIMAGILLDDWAVEIIAADLCRQLKIPCVEQYPCRFKLGSRVYKGVYSKNFELDGYTFISFESLFEHMGKTTNSDEFIKMQAVDKLEYCARQLAEIGGIEFVDTHKYMLDLCLIDILVGNTDRHTRNFGLFFNHHTGKYEIPKIFDNGMGLFENDYYRDNYTSYADAMNNVYVSPYGEDPFVMLDIIAKQYPLMDIYPQLGSVSYLDMLKTPFAREYQNRMLEKIGEIYGRSETDK